MWTVALEGDKESGEEWTVMNLRERGSACLTAILVAFFAARIFAGKGEAVDDPLGVVPEGYHLYAYDDCGVPDRQPHMRMDDSYLWTFATSDTSADEKSRSAIFSKKQVRAVYNDLDPRRSYVIAVTYANDHVYKRVQSLEANGVQIHGPHAIPKGAAERIIYRIPETVTGDGRMALDFKLHGEANVTVSVIELWATGKPAAELHFDSVSGLYSDLAGRVCDMSYEAAPGTRVRLLDTNGSELATTQTAVDGRFAFARDTFDRPTLTGDVRLVASKDDATTEVQLARSELSFKPMRYRPIPTHVRGLPQHELSLDGTWRIDPKPGTEVKQRPLNAVEWADFKVPGQWAEQGFEIPQDKPAALAREFTVPKEWAGYRIFIRFDAIHAGTHYWLNGKPLGYSENLFTPVEWEITGLAEPGQTSRLDLEMTVATASERLSHSSGYTGHTLGGIDRAVRLYALPKLHISTLHLTASLDMNYRDGELLAELGVDNPDAATINGIAVVAELYDAGGKLVQHSVPRVETDTLQPGLNLVSIKSQVPNPLKWNAEQPNLYRLVFELQKDGKMLERIERNIGFRKIELKDRQLYVNGAVVKLAGVCRHEIDPLSGRADTARHAEEDVKLFKSANLNHIRTSHYPPTQELLDACDRIGLYIEPEAPLCWVAPPNDLADLKHILAPTSAMVDYCHTHPSVIIWSLANESHWSQLFDYSNKLCKQLDPSRPTTFNHPFSNADKENADIVNRHYLRMPYDEELKNDPRPFLHGECFFEVYHERTDVAINPGLRELWACGNADPVSEWGKYCAASLETTGLHPGVPPGGWAQIYASKHFIGSEIWSGVDDIFVLPGGKIVSCENGNARWGLIDGWRRPKPELYYSKLIFSPAWFPVRKVDYTPGQKTVRVPVENRYSFTDLKDLRFEWEAWGTSGTVACNVPPRTNGDVELPVAADAKEGDRILLRVLKANGDLVNALKVTLGRAVVPNIPIPGGAPLKVTRDGATQLIEGKGFALVFDTERGDFVTTDPRHTAAAMRFPSVHVTRFDFGDLDPKAPPYAVFPDAATRKVASTQLRETTAGLEINVHDRYDDFAGSMTWLLDGSGIGQLNYDYVYSGEDMNTREAGVRMPLKPACDKVSWRRWSEWDVFPDDAISRTEGEAEARRPAAYGTHLEGTRPTWPWRWDETELGTNDFRAIKLNIYEAALVARDGSGVRVHAKADAHIRPCLNADGVMLHVLSQCRLGPVLLKKGEHVKGSFAVSLQSVPSFAMATE